MIAYTIGAIISYDLSLVRGPVTKLGRKEDYPGGWVWTEKDLAQQMASRTDLGFVAGIYEIEVPEPWSDNVYVGSEGIGHIIQDCKILRRVWPATVGDFAVVWMEIRDALAYLKIKDDDLNEDEAKRLAVLNKVFDMFNQESP
jgi:hypothetical protein